MSGIRSLAWKRIVLVLVIAVAGLAATVNASYAATAVWSNQTPAAGATVAGTQPSISVRVTGTNPIWTSASNNYIKVDGKSLRYTIVFDKNPNGTNDYTKAVLSATPTSPLASGVHHVEASVFDGIRYKTAWDFTVGQVAPVVSGLLPAQGTVVPTVSPVISATVGGTPIASVSVTVDGQLVPSVFSLGTVKAYPTLGNEAQHTVVVSAVAVNGLTASQSSTFTVLQKMQAASDSSCVDCHALYPSAHPLQNCSGCHGEASPVGGGYTDPAQSHAPGTRCSTCHGNLTDCTGCHGQSYATVPALHDFADDSYHISSTTSCSGGGCHSQRLTVAHNYPGRTCLTCHGENARAAAIAAVAAGDSSCSACHSGSGNHLTEHQGPAVAECAECHQSNLVTEHVTNQHLTCATCHDSTDPVVTAAIAAGDLSCTGCHGADAGQHAAVHDGTVGADCASCHVGNLVTEHIDNQALTCATCHDSTDPAVTAAIAAGDLSCTACHGADAGNHGPLHDSNLSASCSGAGCHVANVVDEHEARSLTCATCHDSTAPAVTAAIAAGDLSCTACHGADAGNHLATHAVTIGGCADCHAANLVTEHANRSVDCAGCHASSNPDVSAAIASGNKTCSACHDMSAHPYPAAAHQATVANVPTSGAITDTNGVQYQFLPWYPQTYSGQKCGDCHLMDLLAEHTKPSSSVASDACEACHSGPRDSFADWNQTCQQSDCHPAYHADMAVKHSEPYPVNATAGCGQTTGNCHAGYWPTGSLAAVHDLVQYTGTMFADTSGSPDGCGFCHTTNTHVPPAITSCRTCHTGQHGEAITP